jgi:hypothetical protein
MTRSQYKQGTRLRQRMGQNIAERWPGIKGKGLRNGPVTSPNDGLGGRARIIQEQGSTEIDQIKTMQKQGP